MNEYMVVYTDKDGNFSEVIYKAGSLTEFKPAVKAKVQAGHEFAIYQMVLVHTDWVEQFEEEGAVNA